MTQQFVIEIASKTLYYTMLIAGPILVTGLVVGLLVSIFQSATQIRELTLTFIPKITSVMVILLIALPWMMNKMTEYFNYLINVIQTLNK